MVQIIAIILGIAALAKGELKATDNRVVPAGLVRVLGVALLVAGALPFVLPGDISLISLPIIAVVAIVGVAGSKKKDA